jgi:hypothetical protein
MKRIGVLLLAVALMFILPLTALAEEEIEPSPSPDQSDDESVAAVKLAIDNAHIYEGMDKAFKDGYIPSVKDGKAIIVLPLVASGEIAQNAITVTPDLGGATSPFEYKNYQKTVRLADNAVAGGTTVSSYLVRFDLPLIKNRYNGVYPVIINVEAQCADGVAIQQTFTTYVTITDGADPNAPEPTLKPETPVSQPKIIISGYRINASPVMAGEAFTAVITLKNTSEKRSVQNMTVTLSSDCPNFLLQNDSNVIYISKLGKGDETDINVTYKSDLETPPGRYGITLTIEYEGSEAAPLSASGSVPVAVSQPLRVEMETPQVPESVNAGDTMPLIFQVMNMGRSTVYNVRIELLAPGLLPSETAFIGNMEPGTAMPGEMDVFVGTKNMSEGYEGDEKYGYTNGKMTLIYEDAEGQAYTDETEFSTTINPPVIAPASAEPEEEPEKAGQWWVSVIIGVIIIAGLAVFLIIRSRKGKRQHENF